MKILLAAVAMSTLVTTFVLVAVVEALIRLAPYLLLAAAVYVLALWMMRSRRRVTSADRLEVLPPLMDTRQLAPAPVIHPASVMPPVMPHHERVYLVQAADTGFSAQRADGYFKVDAAPPPPDPYRPAPTLRSLQRSNRHRSSRRTRP